MGNRMMKTAITGIFAVMMAAVCVHAEENIPELTMEQVVEANTKENILKKHDSYLCELSEYGGYETKQYMSDEVTIWSWKSEDGENQEIHSGELAFGNYNGSCEAALLADEAVLAEQAAWEQNLLNPELSVRETIEEASLTGINGRSLQCSVLKIPERLWRHLPMNMRRGIF